MKKKVIDLSFILEDNFPNYSVLPAMSFKQIMRIGKDGSPSNVRNINMPSHGGTHFDAPSHQIDNSRTLENIDLNRCFGPAVMLDFSDKYKSENKIIKREEIEQYDNVIKKGDIVILNTGCFCHPEEFNNFGTLSISAAEYLVEKKIALLAVDTPSVDLGTNKEGKMDIHQILLGNDIPLIESLANLDKLSMQRFDFIGLPLKIKDGDGGPIRAIAIEWTEE